MDILKFLKLVPKSALFTLPLVLGLFFFALFKIFKKEKKGPEKTTSPLAGAELPASSAPATQESPRFSIFLILTILFLLLSLPLAVLLVQQKKELRMKAAEQEAVPTLPDEKNLPAAVLEKEAIKIYKRNGPEWTRLEQDQLPDLLVGEIIRISVKGDPNIFDKARIRLNNTRWDPENEITSQMPNTPGEFYIECDVGIAEEKTTICGIPSTEKNFFKIEAELHNRQNNQWQ